LKKEKVESNATPISTNNVLDYLENQVELDKSNSEKEKTK
jgi:hypothetical protein